MWDEITYPFRNVWEWIIIFVIIYWAYAYLSMPEFKLIHVSISVAKGN